MLLLLITIGGLSEVKQGKQSDLGFLRMMIVTLCFSLADLTALYFLIK